MVTAREFWDHMMLDNARVWAMEYSGKYPEMTDKYFRQRVLGIASLEGYDIDPSHTKEHHLKKAYFATTSKLDNEWVFFCSPKGVGKAVGIEYGLED